MIVRITPRLSLFAVVAARRPASLRSPGLLCQYRCAPTLSLHQRRDVCLHSKVPQITLLRLVYLGIKLFIFVLPPPLHRVNTQHRPHCLRTMGAHPVPNAHPAHAAQLAISTPPKVRPLIHLLKEHFLASLLGQRIKRGQGLTHGRHLPVGSTSRKFVVTSALQSLPRVGQPSAPARFAR